MSSYSSSSCTKEFPLPKKRKKNWEKKKEKKKERRIPSNISEDNHLLSQQETNVSMGGY